MAAHVPPHHRPATPVRAAAHVLLAGLAVAALSSSPAAAQSLRDRFTDLFRYGDCGEPLCLPVAAGQHGRHYVPALQEGQANLLTFVAGAISASVANVPVSATSGGAVFSFVEGRPVRRQISTGPIFAERARTLGQGRLFVGANMTGFSFRTLAGVPLSGLEFNFTHQNVGSATLGEPAFENDVMQVRANLNVNLLVTTFAATYGLSDGVDFGIAVPLVRASFDGRTVAQVQPFGPVSPHVFGSSDDPRYSAAASAYGSATGIGDVTARLKARVVDGPRASLAIIGEARMPTGDEEQLLGAGYLSLRALGVVSATFAEFSPHLNVGYLRREERSANDALLVTLGFDQLIAPPVTLAVDIVSRWQMGDMPNMLPGPVTIQAPIQRTVQTTNLTERRDHAVDGSLGFRLVTAEGITFVTNALVPLRRGAGLQPGVAWTAGLEYVF